jgi:hypothetical protein
MLGVDRVPTLGQLQADRALRTLLPEFVLLDCNSQYRESAAAFGCGWSQAATTRRSILNRSGRCPTAVRVAAL